MLGFQWGKLYLNSRPHFFLSWWLELVSHAAGTSEAPGRDPALHIQPSLIHSEGEREHEMGTANQAYTSNPGQRKRLFTLKLAVNRDTFKRGPSLSNLHRLCAHTNCLLHKLLKAEKPRQLTEELSE